MKEKRIPGSLRSLFPVTESHIYMDHAGVAPISSRVREAIHEAASAMASEGAFEYPSWNRRIEEVRARCGRLVNGSVEEIAFVRSTSHGLSIAAKGLDWRDGDNVVFCERDFPSNMFPWEHLAGKGVETRRVPQKQGKLYREDFEKRIDGRTRVVAVSSVQFASGFRMDLEALGKMCRKRNTLFCVDAIQSLGLFELDAKKCGIDILSADAHKWMLGPEGIGILYCRKEVAEHLDPPLIGWKSVREPIDFEMPRLELRNDALRFEEGAMNILGIVGLGAAVDLLTEIGVKTIGERVLDLGEMIIREADKRRFNVITPRERNERGGAITFQGPFNPEKMRGALRERGVMVNVRGGGLRVSPHVYNREEEIDMLFQHIDEENDRNETGGKGKNQRTER